MPIRRRWGGGERRRCNELLMNTGIWAKLCEVAAREFPSVP